MRRLCDGSREVLAELNRDAEQGVMADYRQALDDLRQLLRDPTFERLHAVYLVEDDASLLIILRDRAEELGLDHHWEEFIEEELRQHCGLIHLPF